MKIKHAEMYDALKNGTIEEWAYPSLQNRNICNYCRFVGDIENQSDYGGELPQHSPSHILGRIILVVLSTAVMILSILCVAHRKNKK